MPSGSLIAPVGAAHGTPSRRSAVISSSTRLLKPSSRSSCTIPRCYSRCSPRHRTIRCMLKRLCYSSSITLLTHYASLTWVIGRTTIKDSQSHRRSNTSPKPRTLHMQYHNHSPTTVTQSRTTIIDNTPRLIHHLLVRSIHILHNPSNMNSISSHRPVRGTCRCMNNLPTSALDMHSLYHSSTGQCYCRHAGLNRAVALLARSVYTWKSPALLRHQ
jgi:hypothetical protein